MVVKPPLMICWVYSERDILPHTVRHMLGQGVDILLLDNWSTDGSYELAQELSVDSRVKYARWPEDGPPASVSWEAMLHLTEGLAWDLRGEYDWFIHQDADELTTTQTGETIAGAITRIDAAGFTAIDHEMRIFLPREGWDGTQDPLAFFTTPYEHQATKSLERGREVKVWKQPQHAVDLAHNGGHTVRFDGCKIADETFIKYHFPLRSAEHARRKIASRRARWSTHDTKVLRWHSHYENAKEYPVGSR